MKSLYYITLIALLSGYAMAEDDDFEPDCWEPNIKTETPCEAEGWCYR